MKIIFCVGLIFLGAFSFAETLPQDIQKEILQSGTGVAANSGNRIKVNYKMWAADALIENQKDLWFTLDEKKLISGFYQGLLGATKGTRFILKVPSHLGYGARAEGDIPANSTLKYEIEVLEVFGN